MFELTTKELCLLQIKEFNIKSKRTINYNSECTSISDILKVHIDVYIYNESISRQYDTITFGMRDIYDTFTVKPTLLHTYTNQYNKIYFVNVAGVFFLI